MAVFQAVMSPPDAAPVTEEGMSRNSPPSSGPGTVADQFRASPIFVGTEELRQRLLTLEAELHRRLDDWLRRAGCRFEPTPAIPTHLEGRNDE